MTSDFEKWLTRGLIAALLTVTAFFGVGAIQDVAALDNRADKAEIVAAVSAQQYAEILRRLNEIETLIRQRDYDDRMERRSYRESTGRTSQSENDSHKNPFTGQ